MSEEKIKRITKDITKRVNFVVLPDGIELEEDLFDELIEADGFVEALVINNYTLSKKLENAGWISTSIRGSSSATDKMRDLKDD